MRILLVDGDKQSRAFLKHGLSSEGFAVDVAADAEGALDLAGRVPYDGLLVSSSLPERAALAILVALRTQHSHAAVIMYGDENPPRAKFDPILIGLDDFLTRPTLVEIAAHLHSALRAAHHLKLSLSDAEELKSGELRMDLASRRVYCRTKEIRLTKKESELLEYLMRHPDRVLSPEMIVQQIWSIDYDGHSNVVQTIVKRLRAKLGDRVSMHFIQTIRGFGYRLAS